MFPSANETSQESYRQDGPEAIGRTRLSELATAVSGVDTVVRTLERVEESSAKQIDGNFDGNWPAAVQQSIVEPETAVTAASDLTAYRQRINALHEQQSATTGGYNAQEAA